MNLRGRIGMLVAALFLGFGLNVFSNNPAPIILKEPLNDSFPITTTNATPGSSFSFTVVASGTEPLEYQWFKQSQAVPGATSATFSIPSLTVADTGQYYVVIRNAFGSVTSRNVVLIVDDGSTQIRPRFVTQPPALLTFRVGETIRLSTEALGFEPLRYQWYVNSARIPGATSPVLTIPNATSQNAGSYFVTSTNFAGFASSDTTSVILLTENGEAPFIVQQPSEGNPLIGEEFSFRVVAGGGLPLSYQWYRFNGSFFAPIPNATASTLTFAKVSTVDSGAYQVIVQNSAGSVRSDSVQLTAHSSKSPVITVNLNSGSYFEGDYPSYYIAADGIPPLQYQWYKNGSPISGETAQILNFPASTREDSGEYSVEVSNLYGSVRSSTSILTVTPVPLEILLQPEPQLDIVAGDSTSAITIKTETPRGYATYWYRDGQFIRQDWAPGTPTGLYQISFTTYWAPTDSGNYYAVLRNASTQVTSTVTRVRVSLPLNHSKRPDRDSGIDLLRDLVAYWPMDSQQDDKTPDVVGGYDLDLNFTPPFRVGRSGAALPIAGNTAQRRNTPDDQLPITKHPAFTIAFWVGNPVINYSHPFLFQEGKTELNTSFAIGFVRGGLATFTIREPGSGAKTTINTIGKAVEPGIWHHLTFVQEEDGRRWFYIDGVEDYANLPARTAAELGAIVTRIGGIFGFSAAICCHPPSSVLIDDVTLWKRALSGQEIRAVVEGGIPGFEQKLFEFKAVSIDPLTQSVKFVWKSPMAASYKISTSPHIGGPWRILGQVSGEKEGEVQFTVDASDPTNRVTNSASAFFRIIAAP